MHISHLVAVACLISLASIWSYNAGWAAHESQQKTLALGLSPWQVKIAQAEEKIYSQSYQDGVLQFLFRDLGVTNKFFVEFGFDANTWEAGGGSNTYNLHRQGWTGLLLDGGNENLEINLHREIIGPHGIVALLDKYHVPEEFDYISIDVDSYDLWVLKEITESKYRPRVISVEYSPLLPLDEPLALAYPHEDGLWPLVDIWGASLSALDLVARRGGYTMVYVVTGTDAILVRSDLLVARDIETVSLLKLPETGRLVDDPTGDACPQKTGERFTLGGHKDHILGWWCGILRDQKPGLAERLGFLEDVKVYFDTQSHLEAKAAARDSKFVQRGGARRGSRDGEI